jgi:hypothetical protein
MAKAWCYLPVRPKYKAKVDKEDFEKLMRHTWRAVKKPSGRLKVVTNIRSRDGRNQQISLGQFLLKPPKNKMVYPRRFMDGFDYRKSNLIVCTMAERQRILPKSRNIGTSRYKGVSFDRRSRLWRAAVKVEGQSMSLGYFKLESQAAEAYNRAAKKFFGPDAYQNLIIKKQRRQAD